MNLTDQPAYQKGRKPAKVKAVRNDARDRNCTLHISGICSQDPRTTVGCHLRLFGFGGMGLKPDDIFIIDACVDCHRALDSREKWADIGLGWDDILAAFMRTLANRRASGLILLKGEV